MNHQHKNCNLKQTPLYNLHLELGAKMAPFAGYSMPLWYPEKIIAEHLHTRTKASLFDVSHMGQISVCGDNFEIELERLVPTDLLALESGKMRYTCLTDQNGGILDDIIVMRRENGYAIIVNAARKEMDLKHLQENLPQCQIQLHNNMALIALQGPLAVSVLKDYLPEAESLAFMTFCDGMLQDIPCVVSRSGYTGEDGFEITVSAQHAEIVARLLLACEGVMPAGLASRDSLRLEAGLRLYGQDMSIDTTPVEAGIHWTISRTRRRNGAREGRFPGHKKILGQIENGTEKRFVGLLMEGRSPARAGNQIVDESNNEIGTVTSGVFSPTLKTPIAMGYVRGEYSTIEQTVRVLIRGKPQLAKITNLPFVPHRYEIKPTIESGVAS